MEEILSSKSTRSRVFLGSGNTLLKSPVLATENSSFQDHVSITNFYKHSETELTSLFWDVSAFALKEWGLWLKRRRSWDNKMMAEGKDLGYHPGILRLHMCVTESWFIDLVTWASYSVTDLITKCHSLWVSEGIIQGPDEKHLLSDVFYEASINLIPQNTQRHYKKRKLPYLS